MTRGRTARLVLLALLAAGLLVLGRLTGVADRLSASGLEATVAAAGPLGPAIYVAAFCVGSLLYLPGLAFVAAAVAAWGRAPGALLALGGAVISVTVSFLVVRAIGGQPLAEVRSALMRRLLARLESHPVTTVIVLRLIFFMGAPLNYALALSTIGWRPYLLGSALGLILPVLASAWLFHLILW